MTNKNNLVEIHLTGLESFACGYILAEDEAFYIIESIDESGRYTGVSLIRISDVEEIVDESAYLNLLDFSVQAQKEANSYNNFSEDLASYTKLSDYINDSIENTKLVDFSIEGEEFVVTGLIKSYQDQDLGIQPLDLDTYELTEEYSVNLADINELTFDRLANYILKEYLVKNGKLSI